MLLDRSICVVPLASFTTMDIHQFGSFVSCLELQAPTDLRTADRYSNPESYLVTSLMPLPPGLCDLRRAMNEMQFYHLQLNIEHDATSPWPSYGNSWASMLGVI